MKNSTTVTDPARTPSKKSLREILDKIFIREPSSQIDHEMAEELIDLSLKTKSPRSCLALLRAALIINPENVQGLLMTLELGLVEEEVQVDFLQHTAQAAAKSLGDKAFKDFAPHFWEIVETRPFLKAQYFFALALLSATRLEEAVIEFCKILELNETDNLGARYELLPLYLALGKLKEAGALMHRYRGDCTYNVVFSWGKVLERLLAKQEAEARLALESARKQNPFIEPYLLGKRKVPKKAPDTYTSGSKNEAASYALALMRAWNAHPEAKTWLSRQN